MSVVGFDLGNESCVVAVARQRGIDVVLNDESKRETPALVCFGDKQRFLGTAGAATITKGPDGFPLINARYLGETKSFTPTQVMGMVFSNMKTIAEKNLNVAVVDCCIGVPIYFTDLQRRAVMDAATIAAFIDIGHASMQVCSEAQCPLVQYITRELLTCLIMEHVMRFASPGYAPVRSDSVVGELKLSEPTDVILLEITRIEMLAVTGIPKIEKLEIEGKAFHTNLYAVRCNYSGGKEGETERIIKHMINLFGLVLSVAPSPAPALPPSFSSIMQRFKSY
uniref:Uncharacterized protein n=1 Tax=Lactuca sativa TaxID=4236 RepID=A0A9R1WVR3_LACSA|nr:hypothetical protein LSAT_V11C800419080 [Lactuca sativa]